jgi:hypothetical protein
MNYRFVTCLFSVLALSFTGCSSGPKTFPISGRVTIDGKPLTRGNVTVWVKDFRPAAGKIDKDGRYTLTTTKEGDGCVAGEHQVTISSQKSHGEVAVEYFIPLSYTRPDESNLKLKVDKPADDANFDLTWKVDPLHKGPYIVK